MNVDSEPAALDELRRHGVAVPAIVAGERIAHGWNPAAYAELLGIAWAPPPTLPPAELAARLDRILAVTERLVASMDVGHLDHTPPERDRPVRDLAYHAFRVALSFVDAMDLGEFPHAWLREGAPPDLRDGAAVARYGALVRGRVAGWFEGASAGEFDRTVRVYYGPQRAHELLERTTWHAAQHLRQLYVLAERLGVKPPEPLPEDALESLPLPEAIW